MNKKYICKKTNKIFDTKEEATEYLVKEFVREININEVEKEEEILREKLEKEFEGYNIKITKSGAQGETFFIKMTKENFESQQRYFPYSKDVENYEPTDIIELIETIKLKFNFMEQLEKEISELGEFQYIKSKGYQYGFTKEEDGYIFEYKVKGDKIIRKKTYYIYNEDEGMEDLINHFKQYFINELEGQIKIKYKYGKFEGYEVDGVPLNYVLKSKKTIKLEVLE